jgi:predicted Ser/Thr protein kinase
LIFDTHIFCDTETETLKGLSPSEIPLNELEIGKEIGEGTYGRVRVGKWRKYRVALKFCQNVQNINEFLAEANIMTYIFFVPCF